MTSEKDRFKLEIHTLADSRTLDIELDLEAAPEDVWRALTEADELGSGLRLPDWLEPRRSVIEQSLPAVDDSV